MESTSGVLHQSAVRIRWRFWLRWVLANALGYGIGFPLFPIIVLQAEGVTDNRILSLVFFLGLTLSGVPVGIMQWLALRPVLSGAQWVFATIIGWAVGPGVVLVLSLAGVPAVLPPLGMPGLALAYGAGAGVFQALVLRHSFLRSVAWVLVSAAGWAAGWALFVPLEPFFTLVYRVAGGLSGYAIGATVGAAGGILTGLALLWLLRSGERRVP